jgi:hypothetical protein
MRPNEQRIEIPEAVVRWSRGQEFAVEDILIEDPSKSCQPKTSREN